MTRKTILLVTLLSFLNISYGQSPAWDWITKAGGMGEDEALSTTSDNNGDLIVAGYFNGSITFGTTTLISSGASDFFITKYDSTGIVLWAKKGGGALNEQITSITTDPWGNIIVTGAFQSPTVTIGAQTLSNSGSWDAFVAKFDPQGNAQWAKQLIGPDHDNANCVIADSTSIVIGGRFKQNISIGTDTLINVSSGTYAFDLFLAKYDTFGNVVWSKSAGGTNEDVINALSFDLNGNILATGYYMNSSITFGSITLTNAGSNDIFLTKFNSSGDVIWAKKAAGTFDDYAYAITVDQNNNPIISGYFGSSKIYFDADSLVNCGVTGFDVFLAKYDSNGNNVWVKRAGTTSMDTGYAVSTDDNNNVLIAGNYDNLDFIFGGDTLTNKGHWDIFLAKYDEFGNELWAKSAGGNDYDETHSNCLHVTSTGRIILAGGFASDSISFDAISVINANVSIPSSTTRDVFLAVLSPDRTTAGLDPTENSPNLMVLFPNPTNGVLNVKCSKPILAIKVFNSTGKLVTTKEVNQQLSMTLELESSGIYFVQITTEDQLITDKIIVE